MSSATSTTGRTWTLVVNSRAGGSDDHVVPEVVEVLSETGRVEVARTSTADELDEVVRSVAAGEHLVALGGDGSLHAVVAAIDRLDRLRDLVVALVPMGTGNDFARTIGADVDDPVAATRALLTAQERAADLIRTGDGAVVVNAAHVGVGAVATRAAGRWKKRLGGLGYVAGALSAGIRTEGFHGRVTLDGGDVPVRGRLLQVAAGNGRYVGAGAPLLPHADPFDGLLDVAVAWADSPVRRLGYALRLRSGDHLQRGDAAALRGRSLMVNSEPVAGNVDGETTPSSTVHTWTVEPQAWRLLVPATEP